MVRKGVVIGVKMPPHPTVDAERKEELILAKQIRGCTVSILPRVSYSYFKINFYCPFLGLVGASCYELSFLKRRLASYWNLPLQAIDLNIPTDSKWTSPDAGNS